MRCVDAKTFFRPFAAAMLLVLPLVAGCGAKSETVQQTPPADVDAQSSTTPSLEISPGEEAGSATEESGPADGPDFATTGGSGDPPAILDSAGAEDNAAGDGEVEPASRPRSMFRSIGRAFRKGLTDATSGAASDDDDIANPSDAATNEGEPPQAR